MISIIVAADLDGAIGADNRVPWRLRDDMVTLKQLTAGHTVILGRKTYDSMVWYYDKSGRPMPGKTYIVITRNAEYKPARGALVAHSIDEAISLARDLGDESILVIGGGTIYSQVLPVTDRIYYTQVYARTKDADAHFLLPDTDEWKEISREHHKQDDRNEFDYDYIIYDRR